MGAECGLEAEASLCSLAPPPSQVTHVHPGPPDMEGGGRQCRDCQLTIPYSPTCTYLQGAVLKVLAGVQLVLQDWGPPSVKGLYSTIYGERDLGWA